MWGVLEHVYDPMSVLRNASRLLKRGGRFLALVTNFNSLPARFMRHDDVPRHTTLFTKCILRDMLRKSGFEPERFYFNSELFGGTHRGVFNYLVKLALGEQIDDIVAQNRSIDRWYQFSSQIRGKQSNMMLKVDRFDIAVTPYLDRIMDWCGYGFIMICQATKG
jgi:SAM-dependent methyltransferase